MSTTTSSHAYGIGIIAVIIALSLTISWYTMFWLPEENQKVFVDEHILNPSGQTTINIIDGSSSPEQEDNYIPKLVHIQLTIDNFVVWQNIDETPHTVTPDSHDKDEITDMNVVKVEMDEVLKNDDFFKAKDFFRIKKDLNNEKIYHHIGIYAFTNIALTKYVKLSRSKLEIERNLEQMRAMENNMIIKVGLADFVPFSVDTKEDFLKVKKEMEKL